jgi:DNA replication protein DnaC
VTASAISAFWPMCFAPTSTNAERRRGRQVAEARFPRMKRLGDFDVTANPAAGAEPVALLASCTFLERAEPVVFLGDSGTEKSHLLIGTGWPPASSASECAM